MTRSIARALVWFRRDLRTADHAALYHALRAAREVWCAFVFDREILDPLPRRDRRVEFIHASLGDLDAQLRELQPGARLLVRAGRAVDEIAALATQLRVDAVYANHDDEPAALQRDGRAREVLAGVGIALHTSKDHVVFERSEVLTQGAKPYAVFTPYKRAWLGKLEPFYLKAYPVEAYRAQLAPPPAGVTTHLPTLAEIGFEATNLAALKIPTGSRGARTLLDDFLTRIDRYDETRDFPAIKGPSYLSVHLRFGTTSIRDLARAAHARESAGAATWLSELIWRDFYHQILHHHPRIVDHSFKPEYERIAWEQGPHAEKRFAAWCDGRTGYPLVDAAMAQINRTGYMHNRLRMIVASFLTKDLGIDWRRGERYFAIHLNDYDLAANNGGWQWAASTGCDAQPWFRIFNPVTQSRRFDPQGHFIRRYLPQLAALSDKDIHAPWTAGGVAGYPSPVVDHAEARARTLERFGAVGVSAPS